MFQANPVNTLNHGTNLYENVNTNQNINQEIISLMKPHLTQIG